MTLPTVLFVDDEPAILAGFTRNLRGKFRVATADGGHDGLRLIDEAPEPFDVVVSDMRMPTMDGAQFLKHVRSSSPSSVRVLLTGQADTAAAAAAVNEGQIARFLFKPCAHEDLIAVLADCASIARLKRSEVELLDRTLRASVRALVDILALADPVTFARATRLRDTTAVLVGATALADNWPIDLAAMLSQLGCVATPAGVVAKVNAGESLTEAEAAMLAAVPAMSVKLLDGIPRLDPIRSIIANYANYDHRVRGAETSVVAVGCAMLRLAADLDQAERRGVTRANALAQLEARSVYDSTHIEILRQRIVTSEFSEALAIDALRSGMVIAEDLLTRTGTLLVSRGYVVNSALVTRLLARAARGELPDTVTVRAGQQP